MAIDTKQKRMSAISPGCPWRGPMVDAEEVDFGVGNRQAAAFMYSGIAAGSPEGSGLTIIERIVAKMLTRLEEVTEANGYQQDLLAVRPLRKGVVDWSHGATIVEQAQRAALVQRLEYAILPAVEWEQDIDVTICVSPSETSNVPFDTFANAAAGDAEWAIAAAAGASWAQWDGLAIDTEQTGRDIENDGSNAVIRLTYQVTYRTRYNDPYTVG